VNGPVTTRDDDLTSISLRPPSSRRRGWAGRGEHADFSVSKLKVLEAAKVSAPSGETAKSRQRPGRSEAPRETISIRADTPAYTRDASNAMAYRIRSREPLRLIPSFFLKVPTNWLSVNYKQVRIWYIH
jgi:hypothetical protein